MTLQDDIAWLGQEADKLDAIDAATSKLKDAAAYITPLLPSTGGLVPNGWEYVTQVTDAYNAIYALSPNSWDNMALKSAANRLRSIQSQLQSIGSSGSGGGGHTVIPIPGPVGPPGGGIVKQPAPLPPTTHPGGALTKPTMSVAAVIASVLVVGGIGVGVWWLNTRRNR